MTKKKKTSPQRKPGLIMVGFHATKQERDLLRQAAELGGFETLADYLRWIAEKGRNGRGGEAFRDGIPEDGETEGTGGYASERATDDKDG